MKTFILSAAVAAALSLTACGGTAPSTPETPSQQVSEAASPASEQSPEASAEEDLKTGSGASAKYVDGEVDIDAFVADVQAANRGSFRSERTAVADIGELEAPTESTSITEFELVDGVENLYSVYTSDGITVEVIVIGDEVWNLEGDQWVKPEGIMDVPRSRGGIEQIADQIEAVEYKGATDAGQEFLVTVSGFEEASTTLFTNDDLRISGMEEMIVVEGATVTSTETRTDFGKEFNISSRL